jgi:serine phosphatase RsbU (regulator of sigma subunit)
MLLGAFPDAEVSDDATDLEPGDALILFTDGVTEAHLTRDDLFGRERLEAVIASCAGLSADAIATRIEDAVTSFAANGLRDDIALLVVRVLP